MLVTIRAYARLAPSIRVADLGRSAKTSMSAMKRSSLWYGGSFIALGALEILVGVGVVGSGHSSFGGVAMEPFQDLGLGIVLIAAGLACLLEYFKGSRNRGE